MSATVSVLMPMYQQGAFLPLALRSLLGQTFQDWELIAVNDGSTDCTEEVFRTFDDDRFRYVGWEENRGIGAALNAATALARGRYIAYLPADDCYYENHLSNAVALLEASPGVHLAYGGVRWFRTGRTHPVLDAYESPSLREDVAPGMETNVLAPASDTISRPDVPSGNALALVQVVHRAAVPDVRWVERSELTSDTLEIDFWRQLLAAGARFSYTGEISCEWGDHPFQHHKIISGRETIRSTPKVFGMSYYKQLYKIAPGVRLNWAPTHTGIAVDERTHYQGLRPPARTRRRGLKILLVGELGFNPERILALEEQGHQLHGLWTTTPRFFDTAGPLPFGNVRDIPHDAAWRERVAEVQPDIVYGLLNWHAITLVHEVLAADLGIPLVFHFKESPKWAMRLGLWPQLREIMQRAAGRIFINEESRRWFERAVGDRFPDQHTLILDGDLPKRDWMGEDWAPKLSDEDGESHTVCVGRPFLEPMRELASHGIHVHIYGEAYVRWADAWVKDGDGLRHLHIHDTVAPGDWVRELSRYDAGWLHVHASRNHGDAARTEFSDFNLPARLGTYAAAGLPWILRDNFGHHVAVERLARELKVAMTYRDCGELARKLAEERASRRRTDAMRDCREQFSFDHHVVRLTDFFQQLRADHARQRSTGAAIR